MVSMMARRSWRRAAAVGAAAALMAGAGVATEATAAAPGPRYVKAQRVCSSPRPGRAACRALRLVRVSARTAGARPATASAYAHGPAGGYTPADLATAYGLNPSATGGKGNVLAVVDAFSDPRISADLNAFDKKYGIPAETSASFKVVGQDGSSRLPARDPYGWSIEQALDVEAARAVCRLCTVLLVETTSDSWQDLAAGVNTAARMGAKEISNSYGGPEDGPLASSIASAYNHKKVVITASTGDDGWHEWDWVNAEYPPVDGPELPAALNTVVGVGGTTLRLNADGTRASEQVWNGNGPGDGDGAGLMAPMGATGGGCSSVVRPRTFQKAVAGYASLGCGAGRSATDVAAVADPATGFDVLSTYDYGGGVPGWMTIGGTSLASPVVAAMWALAGGAHDVDYPALTLYGHFKSAPATYDVQSGGNGACGTLTPSACRTLYNGVSPNTFWGANVDCGFAPNDTVNIGQCYARKGYDGPSGVGTPKGLATFTPMAPAASIGGPSSIAHRASAGFSGAASDPFPGGTVSTYSWSFGDGATATGASVHHAFARAGKYTVTLRATDSYGAVGARTKTVTVS
jgi:hypothetical protein